MTVISVADYNTSAAVNQLWTSLNFFSPESISISGADKAVNVSFFVNTYYVAIDTFVISGSDIFTDYDDLKVLFEVQVEKITGGGGGAKSPGFSAIIGLISVSTAVILIKKNRS